MQYRSISKAVVVIPLHGQTQFGWQLGMSEILEAGLFGRSPEYAKVRELV
jgi:hypothetical protein